MKILLIGLVAFLAVGCNQGSRDVASNNRGYISLSDEVRLQKYEDDTLNCRIVTMVGSYEAVSISCVRR